MHLHQVHGRRRYRPFRLLRYSVPAEYKDIEAAVRSPEAFSAGPYLHEVEGYPTLQFEDCILGLEGHNALYVFMIDESSLHDAKRRRNASRRGHAAQARIDKQRAAWADQQKQKQRQRGGQGMPTATRKRASAL